MGKENNLYYEEKKTENELNEDKDLENLKILKNYNDRNEIELKKTELFKIRPLHERLKEYISARFRIFNDKLLDKKTVRRYNRNTVRMRKFYNKIKHNQRLIVSSIISSEVDGRIYAEVEFLDKSELGLLDTGANISCIGKDLALEDFSKHAGFRKLKSTVRTADNKAQEVIGYIEVEMLYKSKVNRIKLYIVPTLNQRLILGLDFWRCFELIDNIVAEITLNGTGNDKDNIDSDEYPLTQVQQRQLELVKTFFPSFEKQGLGKTSLIKHRIDVGNSRPVKQRFYPVSPAVEKLMYSEVDRMLSLGVIEESTSAWSSPMRLVIKPGKVRLCLDARKINEVTVKDAYPLPNIQGIFARLPKANIISKIDLKDAYWQIALEEESKAITAFTIPGRPLYQFTVMPFGLCTAPQTMCRLMDSIIPPELKHSVFGYLDDVCVVSDTFEEHISILLRLSEQFKKANLTLNINKSKFCVRKVQYLGFIIGNGGISTDPSKVESIINWPIPKTLKQVRGFLGLTGWYRRFISNFADVTHPITELLTKKKKFEWTDSANEAFKKIKLLLTSAPVLKNPDFSKKFYIHCDASDFGIGAVLVQLGEKGEENPIAYMSKKLNSAQRNYSVTEKECLAAIEAIERFRCYIELQEFEVVTDHSSLVWLMRQPNLKGRLARWVLKLQYYKFTISHRKGKDNIVPDALSRMHEGNISSVELIAPEIDLESIHFLDKDYVTLRKKIEENESSYPDIKIMDRYIYIRTNFATGVVDVDDNSWKLWVPEGLRNDILKRFHDSVLASHGGIGKTLNLIRRYFFWPKLATNVKTYINNCSICKSTKATNQRLKPEMGNMSVSERAFQRIYVDLLGPYPRSKKGYIGLLIVLDHFSKYHWLCPLRKFTSAVITEFLEKNIFHLYGVPEIMISDNGSQFRSNEFNAFLTKYGIQHLYTALYSPQSNASERVNRSIIAAIRAYLKKDHREWDVNISAISCALRNSAHSAIGISPYHALYGFDMVTHSSTYKLLKNIYSLGESDVNIKRDDKLAILRENVGSNMKKAYDLNVKQYNLRARPVNFVVGQEVFRRNFAQSNAEKNFNAKLSPLFIKAKVKEKLGNCYYVLEDVDTKCSGTYHAKDIKS